MRRLIGAWLAALAAATCAPHRRPPQSIEPPPSAVVCDPGYHASSGRCCVEGADWVPARGACVCLVASGCDEPPTREPAEALAPAPDRTAAAVEGDETPAPPAAPCPPGKVRNELTAGRCCWREQRWSADRGACVGAPDCEPGYLIDGDDCVAGTIPRWRDLPPGEFLMGSPESEDHRFDDESLHPVEITRPFRIRTTEVTQGEFAALTGASPSRFSSCGEDCPVERVSWHDAAAFANALSEQEGLEPCYRCAGTPPDLTCEPSAAFSPPQTCPGFRLPTEAEWEYAARAGSDEPRYGPELTRIAWYRGNSRGRTHRVATREPNAWGLYDMLGNVMEWCHDWYAPYGDGPATDPAGPSTGTIRALRGGSWLINDWRVRAAYRYRFEPSTRVSYLGFRLVQTLR